MLKHSIKELKRQVEDAYSRFMSANKSLSEAKSNYHQALCERTGLIGKVASYNGKSILIQDIDFYGEEPGWLRGVKIKKDGTAGNSPAGVGFKNGVIFSDLAPEKVEGGATAAEATAPINAINQPNEEKPASGEEELK